MARPTTPRRIASDLEGRIYKPHGIPRRELLHSVLPLDGLEALRLADVEGLYQEEAAQRMGVSRPTFARVLADARRTVAQALVEGRALVVEGGEVERRGRRRRRACAVHADERRGRRCTCRHRRETRGGEPES